MSGVALIAGGAIRCIKTQRFSKEYINSKVSLAASRYFSVNSSRKMKFCQFVYHNQPQDIRAGIVEGDKVIDINMVNPKYPSTLIELLRSGQIEEVKKLNPTNSPYVPLATVYLAAPITCMDKVLCVGLNYKDHCEEQNLTPPEVPMIFSKFPSCVIGPKDCVKLRMEVTQNVDWEVELCLVIGKTANNVCAANAYDYIFGCTVAQDISARDWQKKQNAGQFLLGKAMDTFCPIGPWIVTPDETGHPESLDIQCSLNGVQKQKSNTKQLVHRIPAIIERISSVMTLLPGDIILTGTPGGVGMYRNPPEYLKPGDCLSSEIQNIGVLNTRIDRF